MSKEHWNKKDASPCVSGVQDAQDIAAALLLRRVQSMLREGQPRQAIAHICDMTGVDHPQAADFVETLKAEMFSAPR